MKNIKFLEFETMTVIETGEKSTKYLFNTVKGNRIDINTTILVGNYQFDVDYIIPDILTGHYRLINSNDTIIVELT